MNRPAQRQPGRPGRPQFLGRSPHRGPLAAHKRRVREGGRRQVALALVAHPHHESANRHRIGPEEQPLEEGRRTKEHSDPREFAPRQPAAGQCVRSIGDRHCDKDNRGKDKLRSTSEPVESWQNGEQAFEVTCEQPSPIKKRIPATRSPRRAGRRRIGSKQARAARNTPETPMKKDISQG